MDQIRVVVNGAKGRMGLEAVKAVEEAEDMRLVAACDLGDDFVEAARSGNADAIVDFTLPSGAMENARKILSTDCAGVVGTTGFTSEDIAALREEAEGRERGLLIAPNFAIGAVLMMRFAAEAARFMPEVEIIELHHAGKADAPSGTALKTAALIAEARAAAASEVTSPVGMGQPPRGMAAEGICVHSVRLKGLLAHQEVLFGEEGQTLSIRHDTLSRTSFMPGVLLGIRGMVKRGGLVYGLDNLLVE